MIDFVYDSDAGKVTVGDATLQHQEDILVLAKGDNRFRPTVGFGIFTYIGDESNEDELRDEITAEYERDGMIVEDISFDQDKIYVNANYPS